MFLDDAYAVSPFPFWFASSELLAELFRAELNVVTRLFAESPELPKLFDAPEATLPQRSACFALLAHHKLVKMIDETLISRYEQSPSLGDAANAFHCANTLVAGDEPAWVREVNEVAERLPSRILAALPEPLHSQSFNTGNPEKDEASRLAAMTLSTVEQIQRLAEQVIDQQWRRLAARWPTTVVSQSPQMQSNDATRHPIKQKAPRKRDKQRMARDKLIAEIDDVSETISEFLQTMDERKVRPQPTWSGWRGWVQSYQDLRLRKLIHQDKSRAIARVRSQRKK
jgi:hypothetical protein